MTTKLARQEIVDQEHVIELIAKLRCPLGIERSLKLSHAQLVQERFLAGFDPKVPARRDLLGVFSTLRMPQPLLSVFERELPSANKVAIGFERDAAATVVKVYLEFWERLVSRLRQGLVTRRPTLLYLGLKWDAADPRKAFVDRYDCIPLLSIGGIQNRVAAFYRSTEGLVVREAVCAVIKRAATNLVRDSFVYAQVSDEHGPRKSYDVNLYKSGLRVSDITDDLLRVGNVFGIAKSPLATLLNKRTDSRVGHLSGGTGRSGDEFVTLYYEVDDF